MLWLKALHIIFVVCWFAGIFYLPRIFVNYSAAEHEATQKQLAVMARKLFWFITPFMVLVIIFGLGMIHMNPQYYLHAKWLWVKLGCVVFLVLYHIQCGRYVLKLQRGENRHGHRYYRFFNEVPVIFLFIIVFLTVLKPQW